MCTPPSKVTHVCLLDLDSTASSSHHGAVLCQNPTTKQTVTYLLRFVHIKPSLDETNTADMLHGLPRPKPKNSAPIDSCTCHHAHTMAPTPPHMRHTIRLVACRSTKLEKTDRESLSHSPTRAAWVSSFSSMHRHTLKLQQRVEEHLLMSFDVIGWHHHSTSAATQACPRRL